MSNRKSIKAWEERHPHKFSVHCTPEEWERLQIYKNNLQEHSDDFLGFHVEVTASKAVKSLIWHYFTTEFKQSRSEEDD